MSAWDRPRVPHLFCLIIIVEDRYSSLSNKILNSMETERTCNRLVSKHTHRTWQNSKQRGMCWWLPCNTLTAEVTAILNTLVHWGLHLFWQWVPRWERRRESCPKGAEHPSQEQESQLAVQEHRAINYGGCKVSVNDFLLKILLYEREWAQEALFITDKGLCMP